ncbi:MAG: hypothetical protein JWN57_2208 [Frankiales bacterium]|jgi:hypothetical protein|nr:hypothetical protein [Frankiales bacterium]
MRITDIVSSTPVAGARPATTKRADTHDSAPTVLTSNRAQSAAHPDEVAAAALQRAADRAQATKVVAAQNGLAAESVRGESLSEVLVP